MGVADMAELTDDLRALVAAEVAKALAAATVQPRRRRFFEATLSGPARARKRAAETLEQAGYTVRTHEPIHADDTDGWLTAEVDWTGDGYADGDFQTHHVNQLTGLLQPFGYELRTCGVSAGQVTR